MEGNPVLGTPGYGNWIGGFAMYSSVKDTVVQNLVGLQELTTKQSTVFKESYFRQLNVSQSQDRFSNQSMASSNEEKDPPTVHVDSQIRKRTKNKKNKKNKKRSKRSRSTQKRSLPYKTPTRSKRSPNTFIFREDEIKNLTWKSKQQYLNKILSHAYFGYVYVAYYILMP